MGFAGEMTGCGSMGLARRAAQRLESGIDGNSVSIFHWRAVLLGRGADDVLQIKLEEVVRLWAVVLGAETPLSIKWNLLLIDKLLLHALGIEVGCFYAYSPLKCTLQI